MKTKTGPSDVAIQRLKGGKMTVWQKIKSWFVKSFDESGWPPECFDCDLGDCEGCEHEKEVEGGYKEGI